MTYDLADASYDRTPAHDGPPVRTYVICSTPRSGSSLLSEALTLLGGVGAGGLGVPIEYFDPTATQRWLWRRWACQSPGSYVDQVRRRRTSADGVLGAKLHWFQLVGLAGSLGRSPAAALRMALDRPTIVYVCRRDRDAQAVSWMIAEQSGRWGRWRGHGAGDLQQRGAGDAGVRYDATEIQRCRDRIASDEAGWEALFEAEGLDPLPVIYEEFVASYADTVAAVASHLGRPTGAHEIAPPRLRQQADERSQAFLARYRAEGGTR